MKLENKNVLITGAANRIGREIAISLSKLGFNIGIHYNSSESSANQTLKLVKKNKVEASIIQSDLSNEKNCIKLIKDTEKKSIVVGNPAKKI